VKEYEFELRLSLPQDEAHSDELVERLGDAGCDDALIGIGRTGRIALQFAREGDSAHSAILSAIADVRRALPDAELVEVTPTWLRDRCCDPGRLFSTEHAPAARLMLVHWAGAVA